MSEHRLRRLIAKHFPHQDFERIMSLLESRGKSRSKTGDAADFATLIEISAGNVSVLEHDVRNATEDDLREYSSWLKARIDYLTGPQESLSYFAATIVPLARAAVELKLNFKINNSAVLLFDEQHKESFYLIPTVDEKVFATRNREAVFSGKASSNLTPYEGQFLRCDQVAEFVRDTFTSR